MIRVILGFVAALVLIATPSPAGEDNIERLKSQGKLIVDDSFDRGSPGDSWWVNDQRARRTSGVAKSEFKSQAQIVEGQLQIRRTRGSDHGAAVKTPAEFSDALIELRFRLSGGDKFGVNINDPECKSVHAGHICRVEIGSNHVLIQDQKTGNMDIEYRKLREAGASAEELAKRIAGKSKRHTAKIAADRWHDLSIVLRGDAIEVSIDGTPAGEFHCEGIAHPTKRNIAFAVPVAVDIDDLKIWSLR